MILCASNSSVITFRLAAGLINTIFYQEFLRVVKFVFNNFFCKFVQISLSRTFYQFFMIKMRSSIYAINCTMQKFFTTANAPKLVLAAVIFCYFINGNYIISIDECILVFDFWHTQK